MTRQVDMAPHCIPIGPIPVPARCAVVGLGNLLMSDDGLGGCVVAALHKQLPRHVDLIDGGTLGFLLLDRLAGLEQLILVDAAQLGLQAGAVRVFHDQEVDAFFANAASTSVHEVGLVDLLVMLRLSGEEPRRCTLICVQPQTVSMGLSLSPPVEAALAQVLRLVRDEIAEAAHA